jgi:hypothetical protein
LPAHSPKRTTLESAHVSKRWQEEPYWRRPDLSRPRFGGERARYLDQQQRRTNSAGEWCGNTFDCAVIPEEKIRVTPRGFILDNGERIPHANAAMSGDMLYWQCRRADKTHPLLLLPAAFHVRDVHGLGLRVEAQLMVP